MLNAVTLQGRLVAGPELRRTPSGVSACSFRIAVERSFAKQGEERKADFIDIVTWRQTAEFVCKCFAKGSQILVQGEVQTRSYEDKNGAKRTVVEIVADKVHFDGAKQDSRAQVPAAANAVNAAPPRKYEPAQGAPDDFAVMDDDGDLPF